MDPVVIVIIGIVFVASIIFATMSSARSKHAADEAEHRLLGQDYIDPEVQRSLKR